MYLCPNTYICVHYIYCATSVSHGVAAIFWMLICACMYLCVLVVIYVFLLASLLDLMKQGAILLSCLLEKFTLHRTSSQ